ncbi:hypothetical protein WG908_16155 [Sphingobium sp. AN641]|uniref:hypothetical protein n=1 Tax=Sphingobium sp. AN641 TaxID=3133443 RepID=UPI0030BB48F6
MPEHGPVLLNLQRGASVAEFGQFLADLENAYLALYNLPSWAFYRRYRRTLGFPEYVGLDLLLPYDGHVGDLAGDAVHPDDQLEISRITIQSPGWVELIGSLNPLQQLREYLKDRHERQKDMAWRSDAEKTRAHLENEILRIQVDRDRTSSIGEFNDVLERIGFNADERQRIVWERLGPRMMRLGRHQDSGLLGTQNDDIDSQSTDK